MIYRHEILGDSNFWTVLEFDMSERLSKSHDGAMRRYWIDGFMPESISNTKFGVNVEGEVWIAEGQKNQTKCQFLARVPQKLLYRKMQKFDYEIIYLDIQKKYLEINIQTTVQK